MSAVARQAIAAIITRLQAIQIAAGYNTNAGSRVYLGVRGFDANSNTFPLLSVFSGTERAERLTAGRYRCRREMMITGYVDDVTAPTNALEYLIEDVQRALELADETLGGLVHSLEYDGIDLHAPREDGGEISALALRYIIEYDRGYGA